LQEARYRLAECRECALIFQQEVPNDHLMKRLYERWIDPDHALEQHRQCLGLTHYASWAQEILQTITQLDSSPASLDLFDFGMGWGHWALMGEAFGCNVYGAELCQRHIDHARAHGITVITWDEIPQYRFDFINTEQVFEHLADPLDTLRQLKAALKPNGIIKISVPFVNDIERRLKIMDWTAPKWTKNSLNAVAPLEHINCFRRRSLLAIASLADLREASVPMRRQYSYLVLTGLKRLRGNLLAPIKRNLLRRCNYMLLRSSS
jgi:SAM-dependent methyltransferase